MRLLPLALLVALLVAACGGRPIAQDTDGDGPDTTDLTGAIEVDGSSTVGPFASAAAEHFRRTNPGVRVTVGVSGTGGGFDRFCRGETDLTTASRPIKDEEEELCRQNGIEPIEFQVANDALTVVVNPQNDWVDCLTTDQLRTIWDRGSRVQSWRDVDASWPAERMRLYGPGTDSGTFDYFTDEINGEEGRSRSDFAATEDDNVIVQGVAGNRGALGYFGLSYYEQNQQHLKALAIDGGDGCVEATTENAQTGRYAPLARPLFIYGKRQSLEREEVYAFVEHMLEHETDIARRAQFVPMTEEQLERAREDLEQVRS